MNMISPNHNYDDGYIGLVNLPLTGLPPTIRVGEYELLLKSEFHISLACVKRLAPLIDPNNVERIQDEIVDFFKEFIKTTPLTDYRLTSDYRLVKRDDRVTLVILAHVPDIKDFFTSLKERYDVALPVQVTHVTLYTLQPEKGIGITSPADLERDSIAVTVPLSIK